MNEQTLRQIIREELQQDAHKPKGGFHNVVLDGVVLFRVDSCTAEEMKEMVKGKNGYVGSMSHTYIWNSITMKLEIDYQVKREVVFTCSQGCDYKSICSVQKKCVGGCDK